MLHLFPDMMAEALEVSRWMFIQKSISSLVLYSWHASRDSCLHFTMDNKSLEKTGYSTSCAHSSSNSIFQMLPLLLQPLS